MVDEQVFVVFRITGDHYDEFIGVASTVGAAQRLCLDDQKKKLVGWHEIAHWREAQGRTNELVPVIDMLWYEDADGDLRTTEGSTFVRSYDRGYLIIPSRVEK